MGHSVMHLELRSRIHELGCEYGSWNAHRGVPWVMCKEDDAPDSMINACNGFYCDAFSPNRPNKPKMWTEAWSGWFTEFGGAIHQRAVQDLAFFSCAIHTEGRILC